MVTSPFDGWDIMLLERSLSHVKSPTGLLFLLASGVYLNCLSNGFAQDDFYYILPNPEVRQFSWLPFTSGYLSNVYRPLGTLSFAVNYALGGMRPLGFHLLNVVLHAVVTVLLYWLLRELVGRSGAAFAAALLFAVHPIHTEAVAAIVGRMELLAAGFLAGAWLLHLRGRFLAASLCFFLALLSKESAVAFLMIAPLADWAYRRRVALRPYTAYVCAFGAYFLLWWIALGRAPTRIFPFLDNPLAELPPLWRALNALRIAWKYLALQLFPVTLSADYSFNAIPGERTWTALLPALLASAALLGFWFWTSRRHPDAFLAGTIYLGGFAVTANVVFPIGTIMAERLAYLPSAGLCLLAGLAWECSAARKKTPAVVGLAIVITLLAGRTVVRNRDWRNNFTLFSAAVMAAPENARAHFVLGVEYMNGGDQDRALGQFEIARRIYPDYPDPLVKMGLIYFQRGDRERAERFMKQALLRSASFSWQYDEIGTHYAALLMESGRRDAALALLNLVLATNPRYARAYSNRAVLHYYRDNHDRARADAETALRLDPNNKQARAVLDLMSRPAR